MRPSQKGKRQQRAGAWVRNGVLRATMALQANRLNFAAQGRGGWPKPGSGNWRQDRPARRAKSSRCRNAAGKAIASRQSVASANPVSSRPSRWGSWMPLASIVYL